MSKAEVCLNVRADVTRPDDTARREALLAPLSRDSHARLVEEFDVLRQVEYRPPPQPATPARDSLKIVVWNAERGKFLDDSARLLRAVGADANLLSEFDLGMARSGQLHTARQLAGKLDQGYVFAVEFVELGLGDAHEQAQFAGASNDAGLHGGAILSPHELIRPGVIRLEHDGDWFDNERSERRVGGRIAVTAQIELAGQRISLVSVHFESHTGPAHRAEQMAVLLDGVERYADGGPVILAGDFNCKSMPRAESWDPSTLKLRLAEDPNRLLDPVSHEPLFDLAAKAGYDWRSCNEPGATTRPKPDDPPEKPPPHKIDWIFMRGLAARDPAILPAIDAAGEAISDHEVLVVTILLEDSE
jgi:endonuclease/exonuclease/phosphatase family metal-dependent hydrolase